MVELVSMTTMFPVDRPRMWTAEELVRYKSERREGEMNILPEYLWEAHRAGPDHVVVCATERDMIMHWVLVPLTDLPKNLPGDNDLKGAVSKDVNRAASG